MPQKKSQRYDRRQPQNEPYCIIKDGAFTAPACPEHHTEIIANIHLPAANSRDGNWYWTRVISAKALAEVYHGQYVLHDSWYAIFYNENMRYYIPVTLVHPIHEIHATAPFVDCADY